MDKVCVGIDIAKRDFVTAVMIDEVHYTKSFKNHEDGFEQLLHWLTKLTSNDLQLYMESTGKYGNALATYLFNQGQQVSVINPAKIKYFSKSQLTRNKTDKADAKLIREYGHLFNPAAWQPVAQETRVLQDFVKRIEELGQTRQREKNRLELASPTIKDSIDNLIHYLDQEIKSLEEKINQHIQQHESLNLQAELLNSIPAISDKTTHKILSFIGDINRFDHAKKLVAFLGLNPHIVQSGTSVNHSHLSRTGNANLRKMFYMPALVAIRHNPILKAFYHKLLAKGKPKKVAICAVMRKLVHIVYGVLKSKKPFDSKLSAAH